jgi:hypothetical protein
MLSLFLFCPYKHTLPHFSWDQTYKLWRSISFKNTNVIMEFLFLFPFYILAVGRDAIHEKATIVISSFNRFLSSHLPSRSFFWKKSSICFNCNG